MSSYYKRISLLCDRLASFKSQSSKERLLFACAIKKTIYDLWNLIDEDLYSLFYYIYAFVLNLTYNFNFYRTRHSYFELNKLIESCKTLIVKKTKEL